MSKLLKLKKYFTVVDAARYLSKSLEVPVSVADIYELALDNELTVSVRLIDQAYAIVGQYVSGKGCDTSAYPIDVNPATNEALDEPYIINLDDELKVSHDKWLVFDKQVRVIDGIWDLAMIGMELHKVKELYQEAIDGPSPQINVINGFYLQEEERIYQLQSVLPLLSNEDNHAALEAKLDSLLKSKGLTARDILNGGNPYSLECLSDDELEEFMELTFAQAQEESGDEEGGCNYLPLEEHSYQFVIRTAEISRFLQALEGEPLDQDTKSLLARERNTLLALIGVLCEEASIDISARGISTSIEAMTQRAGVPISNGTIKKIVDQVDDAMERRRK